MNAVERLRNRIVAPDCGDGFTLIELLVVLLIIGILLAIAIPTFLSSTTSANNTTAQENLQSALTASNAFYAQPSTQSYVGLDYSTGGLPSITAIGEGVVFVSGSTAASSAPQIVSLWVPASSNGTAVVLTALAHGSWDCWGILDIKTPLPTAVLGETAIGTYWFVKRNTTSAGCIAQTVAPSTVSTAGFPAA